MDLEQALAQIGQALGRADSEPPVAALMALVSIVVRDLHRSADALEHIARNLPAAK